MKGKFILFFFSTALDQKVEVLKAESKRVEDAVMTLGDLEKTLGNKVRKNNEEQREGGLTMAMVWEYEKIKRIEIYQDVFQTYKY